MNKLNELLQKEKYEIAMPNELFEKLLELKKGGEIKSTHIGFTYSYIYLQTYMYRYCTYEQHVPSVEEIKKMLTYSPKNKEIDYIIKKDGVLEYNQILYTESDFPIMWELDEYEDVNIITIKSFIKEYDYPTFDMWRKERGITRRATCKYPSFIEEGGKFRELDGTNVNIANTTMLDMPTFMFCMQTDGIGVNGFYLYAYLKHQSFKYNDDFRATFNRISRETGMSVKTVQRVMNVMREHNVITTKHNMEYFSLAIRAEERKASSHIVNDVDSFSIEKIEVKKLEIVDTYTHIKNKGEVLTDKQQVLLDISLESLPF